MFSLDLASYIPFRPDIGGPSGLTPGRKIEIRDRPARITVNTTPKMSASEVVVAFNYKKNAEGLYVCPYCPATYERQNSMHYHLKKHAGMYPHKCKHCSKEFLQKQTLDLHMEAKHPEKLQAVKMHVCPCGDCPYESRTKANLIIHYMRIHCAAECKSTQTKDKMTRCEACKECFKSQTAYYYHAAQCTPPSPSQPHYKGYLSVMGQVKPINKA